jgi:hypothetical protein
MNCRLIGYMHDLINLLIQITQVDDTMVSITQFSAQNLQYLTLLMESQDTNN